MPALVALAFCVWLALAGSSPGASAQTTPTPSVATSTLPERLAVEVVATYPHDPDAFTQGLLLLDGTLYESTGLVGRSSLRQVEISTGKVMRQVDVPPPLFAEGIAAVGRRMIQLTWQNRVALVYDLASLETVEKLAYPTEGWGLCYDGRRLVMSDGSATLYFRDPQTFDARGTLVVTNRGKPVEQLNELECVGNAIYANVWLQDHIVRIDAGSGRATAIIEAKGLLTRSERERADVLNGIAYDAETDTFLITGKLWPKLFRVRFVGRAR